MLQPIARTGRPIARIDVAAAAGQFLAELSLADLVVELVQNDLDAGASRTMISFGDDALEAEGDGGVVDDDGWKRLSFVLGAGHDVAAKAGGIGSKNHGLRAMYLLADEFAVQSGGYRTDLTARGDLDRPNEFYPASWDRVEDDRGPAVGTRVTAIYRTSRLRKPDGDGGFLETPEIEMLDALWRASVEEAPERFVTASAPGAAWRYELVLARAGQESRTFLYECRQLRDGLVLRSCKRRVGEGPQETIIRRHGSKFSIPADDLGDGRVPKLFQVAKKTFGEISWRIDGRDMPVASAGLLRYPIAFPHENAYSGVGFDISAPFLAARARHGLSEDRRNARLVTLGVEAFAKLAGRRLVERYGPRLGSLVVSDGRVDSDASDMLTRLFLREGALSVCARGTNAASSIKMKKSQRLVIACSRARDARIDRSLLRLSSRSTNLLHPQTPEDVVERLFRTSRSEIDVYDEMSAAKSTFVEDIPQRVDTPRLSQGLAVLDTLERLRKRLDGLPTDIVKHLKEHGRLPTRDGTMRPWGDVRRSRTGVPVVPGIAEPVILHPALSEAPLLETSKLRLPVFDIDDHLRDLDFEGVKPAERKKFFEWLVGNVGSVKRERLAEITTYPIWPGSDGTFRALHEYCLPTDRQIASMLKEVCLEPAREVVLLLVRKGAKGRLKVRGKPTKEEHETWYNRAVSSIDAHFEDGRTAAGRTELDRLEDDLARLAAKRIAVEEIAAGHRTLAKDGELRAVAALHAISPTISACALPPEFLCRPRRSDLYVKLGAAAKPTDGALLEALRRTPDRANLFIRLDQYKRCGRDLRELSAERIIPVGDNLYSPSDLAFRSEPDLWGAWKTKLDRLTGVPADHKLLIELGVTPNSLKSGLSPAFFEWLGNQSRSVQQQHLPQILRHWRDHGQGPAAWALIASDVRCVPVIGRDQRFELITVTDATSSRSRVFTDDFPALRRAALESGNVRLAIDTDGNQISVISAFGLVGIKSLKHAAGAPVSITVERESKGPENLLRDLAVLKSPKIASTLKSRLPKHAVLPGDIKVDVRSLVSNLSTVRLGRVLKATHAVAGAQFEIDTASAVEVATGCIFVSSQADPVIGFYSALANYLFRPGSSPQNAWGLMMTVRENASVERLLFGEESNGDEVEEISDDRDADEGTEFTRSAHGEGAQLSLTPSAPKPAPLTPIGRATYPRGRTGGRQFTKPSATEAKRNSLEEQEHIRALKDEHYALQCQACLGSYEVLKAAPPNSYVYSPGYRRRLIEAHHVQHLQNAGGLGASNLLILCSYHHLLIGDELSRETVRAALLKAERTVRRFPTDLAGLVTERREGLLATVAISKDPFAVKLFFTKEHAACWQA